MRACNTAFLTTGKNLAHWIRSVSLLDNLLNIDLHHLRNFSLVIGALSLLLVDDEHFVNLVRMIGFFIFLRGDFMFLFKSRLGKRAKARLHTPIN